MEIYIVMDWCPTEPSDRKYYFYTDEVEANKHADALRGDMWREVDVFTAPLHDKYNAENKPAW